MFKENLTADEAPDEAALPAFRLTCIKYALLFAVKIPVLFPDSKR